MFDIQLFGPVEVRTRGILLAGADFGGDRPRQLLALLALRGEMSTSELADVLGGTKDIESDMSLLATRLEPGGAVVRRQRGRWSLDPDRVRVDAARFDELITAAATRPAGRASRPLAAAAFLAARPLLENELAPWAAEARAEYRAKLVMARLDDAAKVI